LGFQDRVDVALGRIIFWVQLDDAAEGFKSVVQLVLVAKEEAEVRQLARGS
jgi:hypothetical protein